MTSGDTHPDVERLADLDAGLLDNSQVAEHVASCAQCRQALTAFDAVRADLTRLSEPPADAMPADVAQRIDAALAEARNSGAAGGTVLPMHDHRQRRWWQNGNLAGAAAVVVLLALGVGIVVNHSADHGQPGGGGTDLNSSANAPLTHLPTVTTSGRSYTEQNLGSKLPAILATPQPTAMYAGVQGGSATGGGTATGGAEGATSDKSAGSHATNGQVPETLSQPQRAANSLATRPSHIRDCVAGLQVPVAPIAIDVGTFRGKPAVVIVFPRGSSQVDVYILEPACPIGEVEYFHRYARPPA